MKKMLCWALALLLCLSGAALAEMEDGIVIEYPQYGFNLRLPKEFTNIKGSIHPSAAMEVEEGSGVYLYSAVYMCLTEEEFEANRDDADPNSEIRSPDAMMPFITLIIIKGETSLAEAGELIGVKLDTDAIKVQAKAEDYTFYAYTKYDQTEVPDPAYAEEYDDLMSKLGDILDGCDYYVPYVQKVGVTDPESNPNTNKELFVRRDNTLLNPGSASTKKDASKEDKPAYTVRVVDQNGDPVPEAAVGFCLDTGCIPVETDENGVAVYSGAPNRYHIRVVDAPDEYDYPDDTDTYIGPESGEITLVITKE